MTSSGRAQGPTGRLLDRLCRVLAMLGGALLSVFALLATGSVVGRACCNAPLPGDYELAQVAVAVAVSLCLPWCQWRRGHIAVDFFTQRLSPRAQIRLDAAGALVLGLMSGLLTWRVAAGALALREVGETTMILGFPVWLGYAGMVPGLALAGAAALYLAAHDWRQSYRWV